MLCLTMLLLAAASLVMLCRLGPESSLEELLSWRPDDTRPPDFESFWQETLSELAAVPPEFRIEYAADQSTSDYDCFDIGYRSLGHRVVRGWLTVPAGEGPFPVGVYYHARGGHRKVLPPAPGLAAISISWRGGAEDPEPPDWMTRGIGDPHRHSWRSAVANAERVCHLVERMPGVDAERVGLIGFSMGGAIALIIGGLLGEKVKFISTTAPGPGYWFLGDGTPSESRGTMLTLLDYISASPQAEDSVRSTCRYFEALNFAQDIKAPTLMSVGLRDEFCTPEMTLALYNHLECPKCLEVFDAGQHGKGGGMETSREIGEQFVADVLAGNTQDACGQVNRHAG